MKKIIIVFMVTFITIGAKIENNLIRLRFLKDRKEKRKLSNDTARVSCCLISTSFGTFLRLPIDADSIIVKTFQSIKYTSFVMHVNARARCQTPGGNHTQLSIN